MKDAPDYKYLILEVRRAYRYQAARGAVLLPFFGKGSFDRDLQSNLNILRGIWRKKLRGLYKDNWPRLPTERHVSYARNCPPFGVKTGDRGRRCGVPLICPFCYARQFVDRRFAVGRHRGSARDFLARHERDVRKPAASGMSAVRQMAPDLHQRIADPRTRRLAWDHLAHKGGRAPGPDGRHYVDYSSEEVWDPCKCLADAVRSGAYRPGAGRVVEIRKSSGGTRPLVVLNIADRVVQRAAVSVLQPLLDPLFDVRSFGYRPGMGHLHALALGESLAVVRRRRVWVTQDIKDAFQQVPINRLLQVVVKLLPDDRLTALLRRVLTTPGARGLPQGGPLSPLMLNVYLNHFLDRPWRRRYQRLPMPRVADDLLVDEGGNGDGKNRVWKATAKRAEPDISGDAHGVDG